MCKKGKRIVEEAVLCPFRKEVKHEYRTEYVDDDYKPVINKSREYFLPCEPRCIMYDERNCILAVSPARPSPL